MKGYQPNLNCKKQVETSSKTGQFILELGMKQEVQCGCENGKCKYDEDQIKIKNRAIKGSFYFVYFS